MNWAWLVRAIETQAGMTGGDAPLAVITAGGRVPSGRFGVALAVRHHL